MGGSVFTTRCILRSRAVRKMRAHPYIFVVFLPIPGRLQTRRESGDTCPGSRNIYFVHTYFPIIVIFGGGRFSPLTWNSRELIAFHAGIRRGSASTNKENGSAAAVGCEAKEEPANRVHAIDHFSGSDRRHPADYNSRQTVFTADTRTRCRENSIDPLI